MHAAEALTRAGYGDEVKPLLERRLKAERDDRHRCGLARELVRAGDREKASVMLDILARPDTYALVHACESLYKVNEIGDGRMLRRALNQDENPREALMAAAALGRRGDPAALALLRKRARDNDPKLASIAAWVLGRIGNAQDIPALRAGATRFRDPLIRAYFEHALAALGDADGLAALRRNLASDNPSVRTYAAAFAAEAHAISCAKELIKLLDDENIDVRVRAAESLLVLSKPKPHAPLR